MTKKEFFQFLSEYDELQRKIFHSKTIKDFAKLATKQEKLIDEIVKTLED